MTIEFSIDPYPENGALNALWATAWNEAAARDFSVILSRSLAHIGAFDGVRLVGFVNVASDGGIHAFILDTCVAPEFRRQGIATRLVEMATNVARKRGAEWLHVDFQPHLTGFYRSLGFTATEAGLLRLRG
ncbi:GNAT family N-acetyltransferase [Rhizobium leucaenae]|uniref:Ribosomal protein S18 acetylase RimI-like enzyme n=1 Tax=Rhizobium leucaenae TaxID=29450 RepID=A0A7W6ZZY3_9HYPH|nr:GNAT family N-acetyltransferase [Rhizobium leucaenae]MBB4571699.1 ribosomal protein S18 acetylase RimI-like enzyme [Rhizobium leucaenae]MBB6305657.1 ribosomal protein S18 acetylase RimI-like enzyme [Rhizobium leucaenae]